MRRRHGCSYSGCARRGSRPLRRQVRSRRRERRLNPYASSTPARRLGSGDGSDTHARGARCVCQANRRAEFRRWHVDDAEVYDAPGDVYTQLGDMWGVRQGRKYAVDVSRGVGKHVRVQLEHENGRHVAAAGVSQRHDADVAQTSFRSQHRVSVSVRRQRDVVEAEKRQRSAVRTT